MSQSFRSHHLLALLDLYDTAALPLPLVVNDYFRAHSSLGSKDRKYIAETVYGMVRWRALLDALVPAPATWEKRVRCYSGMRLEDHVSRGDLPLAVRCSCPVELFQLLVQHYGEEQAFALSLINNTPAPTTIRVNALKITREDLFNRWKDLYPVALCAHAQHGIVFQERISLFSLPEFKEGLFEMQDEASQQVAELVQVQPGDQVLDYCSGSGGKTLAFASSMQGKGQIYLHDIRANSLREAKQRLRRAGIQNAQWLTPEHPQMKRLKKKMDWILVDAPCTGTGTLRRNPDMKWRFSRSQLQRLVEEQRLIFGQALHYLKPNGRIVYATCSILPEENQEQIAYFCSTHGLKESGAAVDTLPTQGGPDGFFARTLLSI